jgi:hypothetical protein
MDKQQYKSIRNSLLAGQYPSEILYEMYTDLRKEENKLIPFNEFQSAIVAYANMYGVDSRKVINHFDQKFGIMTAIDTRTNQQIAVL